MVKWTSDQVTPALRTLMPRIDAAVGLAFDVGERQAESYARLHAPWQDRTGNARNGLFAEHISNPLVSHELIVYHTMPYGLWLEVRFSGRYAIINPTLTYMGPRLSAMIAAAVNRALSRAGGAAA